MCCRFWHYNVVILGVSSVEGGFESCQHQPLWHVCHNLRQSSEHRRYYSGRQGSNPGLAEHQGNAVWRHIRVLPNERRKWWQESLGQPYFDAEKGSPLRDKCSYDYWTWYATRTETIHASFQLMIPMCNSSIRTMMTTQTRSSILHNPSPVVQLSPSLCWILSWAR